MPKNNQQIIVFVKAPIPGQCKTRLTPYLNNVQASEFYQTLVHHCFENLRPITDTDIAIYYTPCKEHPFISEISHRYAKSLYCQQGNDLGERMHHAISRSLKTYNKCVLIGTDCPVIDSDYITEAFQKLDHNDIVLGPAEDGGYVLIAANKINASIFNSIEWSSPFVLQQSMINNKRENFKTHLLNMLWDIDTPQDYNRYIKLNER